jgi:putative ABC transport system permease protein
MQFWRRRTVRLQEEIQTHIESEIEENIQCGMSPGDAHRAAHRKFGNRLLAVERSRELWGSLWLEYLLHDVRHGLRSLLRSPGFTAAAVLTLALGLGSVTAILAVVDSVLLRPVALPHPEELVVMYARTAQRSSYLSFKQIDDLRQDRRSLSAIAGYDTSAASVVVPSGSARSTMLTYVTPEYFKVLGVSAQMGRPLGEGDVSQPVVVLSHEFWLNRMQGDPHVAGTTLKVYGELRTIVGVMPAGLGFPANGEFLYEPMPLQGKTTSIMVPDTALAIGRLRPGITVPQSRAELGAFLTRMQDLNKPDGQTLVITPITRYLTSDLQSPLLALMGGVGILLLIACANAANLQIARAIERLPEMQVRLALGASFPRILQQLLVESLIVSSAGAAVGGALAYAAIIALREAYADRFIRFHELGLHPEVLASVALLAILAGLLASLAPAFATRRRTVTAEASRRTTTSRHGASTMLVTAQITLTCVLLVTCSLFVRTFFALRQVPLGFDPQHVTMLVASPQNSQLSPEAQRQVDTELLHRFESLPGVDAATMQSSIPFSNFGFLMNGVTDISGRVFQKNDTAFYTIVSSNFVRASGIHLLQGRGFLPQDDGSGDMVALVNQAFVDKFLEGRNPVGIGLKMHRETTDKDSDMPILRGFTVVGVVQNEMQGSDLASAMQPMIYLDDLQIPEGSPVLQLYNMMGQFAMRSSLPQDVLNKEIRGALKQVAPDMVEMQLETMEQGIRHSLEERRIVLRLVSGFGSMALVLAAIGIYGILAYTVSTRRREIGVRMALGSPRIRISRLILQQAARMVVWGLVPGIAGAWAAEHAVRSFLYGVKPLDPPALAASVTVLALTAAMAAAIPAWRVTRVDLTEALRVE